MATIIKPKRSRNLGIVPTTSQLADGEIAVNIPDQRIYIRDGANIRVIAQAPTGLTAKWTYLDQASLSSINISNGVSIGLAVQKRYLVNTTEGPLQLNLPTSSLEVGDSVEIADPLLCWGINPTQVNTLGFAQIKDQLGNVEDGPMFLDVSGGRISFIWTGTFWSVIY